MDSNQKLLAIHYVEQSVISERTDEGESGADARRCITTAGEMHSTVSEFFERKAAGVAVKASHRISRCVVGKGEDRRARSLDESSMKVMR